MKYGGEIKMGDTAYRNTAILCLIMGVFFVLTGLIAPQFMITRENDKQNYYLGSIISLTGIGIVFVSFGLIVYRVYRKPTPRMARYCICKALATFLVSMMIV